MPETEAPRGVYRFDRYALDIERGELSDERGPIPLRPQSFDVLALLVANRQRLVTKEEFYSHIWGNKAVTDDSLAQCVIDIRRALGDSERKMVRTAPRRGYIFTAALAEPAHPSRPDDSAAPRPSQRALLFAVTVIVALVAVYWLFGRQADRGAELMANSIAVLPFIDRSAAGDQSYLGEGLSEDILNALTRYPGLRVIARTSSFAMAERAADIQAVRESLGVAYVLEGSIRRTGDRLNIVAQLIDTADSTHIWSDNYQLDLPELATVRQLIAAAVVQQILPELQLVANNRPPRDVSVNELMLLARLLRAGGPGVHGGRPIQARSGD